MKNYVALLSICALSFSPSLCRADQFTVLKSATTYAVHATAGVTNDGPSAIVGDVGVSPTGTVTGLPSGSITGGSFHINDGPATTAHADAVDAYGYLAGLSPTANLTGQDLGGMTLHPGIYWFASSAQLTGILTLDFQGLDNVNIIIQTVSTLTTASSSSVNILHHGVNDNVYYAVGSSATLGTNSTLRGDILAAASITFNTGANVPCGSAMALNGAVTLDSNSITNCSSTGSNITPYTTESVYNPTTVPEPGSLALLTTGVLGGAAMFRRKFHA